MTSQALQLRWRPSAHARRLSAAALLALAAAIVTGRAALVLLAAPALAVLATAGRIGRCGEINVDVSLPAGRCFEGEDVEVRVTVECPHPLDEITVSLPVPGTFRLAAGPASQTAVRAARAEARWALRPARWGRHQVGPVRIECRRGARLWHAAAEVAVGRLDVFPWAQRLRTRLVPPDLLRRIGDHVSRATGEGVEFAGIRPLQPGDRLRDINWPVSRRRGRMHVNQRAAARAADLVVMIDTFSDAGPPGASSLDASVRGAATLADAYLRGGDRVGAVAVGGLLTWLAPAPGNRHFYRIAELVIAARYESAVTPDLDRIPRTALPPGALVVLFSPLLDDRALGAIRDLRQRRFPLIVVDVLRHEPPAARGSAVPGLALRLWRLDRAALRLSLADLGVPVLAWDGTDGLDAALAPARRMPLRSVLGSGR